MSTDDIQHFDGVEAMAEAIDPEGYQAELEKRAEADPERTEMVKNQINGYYWTCYVNSTTYELEFWATPAPTPCATATSSAPIRTRALPWRSPMRSPTRALIWTSSPPLM